MCVCVCVDRSAKCDDPPVVDKASHNGPAAAAGNQGNGRRRLYELGVRLRYSCEDGYYARGFDEATCMAEGRWVGPRMTCRRKSSTPHALSPRGIIAKFHYTGPTHTHARTHARAHTRTHTHRLRALFPGLPRVSRYQKGKTNLGFTVCVCVCILLY